MNHPTLLSTALAALMLPALSFATERGTAPAASTPAAGTTAEVASPNAGGDATLTRLLESMVDCPSSLLEDPELIAQQQESIALLDVAGELIKVAVLAVPGSNARCAALTSPGLVPLSPAQYAALINHGPAPTVVVQQKVAQAQDSKLIPPNPQVCTSNISSVAKVYAGRCGLSHTPIASAYFATPYLALTAGAFIPANTDLCVYLGGYFDVHAVNRSNGTGDRQLAGLSLVRAAPFSTGFRVLTGNPIGDLGAAHSLQIDAVSTFGDQRCQSGPTEWYTTEFAGFYGSLGTTSSHPTVIQPGGAGWEKAAPTQPIAVHVNNEQVSASPYIAIHPVLRRFIPSDVSLLEGWASTSVPAASKSVTITNPTASQLIDSANGMYVTVNSNANWAMLLDGQPVSNPLVGLADGWHDLVAYNVAEPQYRHLVRFEARRITGYADTFEPDDTRETFKPLYDGLPQSHSFHTSMNADWTAFAVVGRARGTVTLNGTTAFRSALKIYRHSNYPNGQLELLMTRSNTVNQLTVSGDSVVDGVTVFYVEAVPTHIENYGPTQNYTLSLAIQQLPDGYEYDDVRTSYKPLYGGRPQTHGFHTVNDQDWVAYAVTAGVSSRVELTGSIAAASEIKMYRHINHPTGGEVELVDMSSATPGVLSVEHTAPAGEPYSVYYIRAAPNAGNPAATGSIYTLNVTTWTP